MVIRLYGYVSVGGARISMDRVRYASMVGLVSQQAGPDMRVWVRPVSHWAGPVMCLVTCGMRYLRELTKLCAYGFQFMFLVLQFSNGRTRDDCRVHITCFRIL